MLFNIIAIALLTVVFSWQQCSKHNYEYLRFHLVRRCQRFQQLEQIISLEQTVSLEECARFAKRQHGLAINYAPPARHRLTNNYGKPNDNKMHADFLYKLKQMSVFEEPAEYFNCHVLQCPENASFANMINDTRFDYYSLYGRPTALGSYICLPGIGLFRLHNEPTSYENASVVCRNSSDFIGGLAHIASEGRTNAVAKLLSAHNKKNNKEQTKNSVYLAYIDLFLNRTAKLSTNFHTANNESLNCFFYRAWDVGYPMYSGTLINSSCVAVTSNATWRNVDCKTKLPFICEIFTNPANINQIDIGLNSIHGQCN